MDRRQMIDKLNAMALQAESDTDRAAIERVIQILEADAPEPKQDDWESDWQPATTPHPADYLENLVTKILGKKLDELGGDDITPAIF